MIANSQWNKFVVRIPMMFFLLCFLSSGTFSVDKTRQGNAFVTAPTQYQYFQREYQISIQKHL